MEADWNLRIPAAFPLVCVVLDWLAIEPSGLRRSPHPLAQRLW